MSDVKEIKEVYVDTRKSLSPPANVTFYKSNAEGRGRVEAFLRDGFEKKFSAKTNSFMPLIMETSDNENNITACVGIRRLEDDLAFLECYLDTSIESFLEKKFGKSVERNKVIELGSIISNEPGAGGWLIIAMAAWLKGAGYEWAVLTATDDLKKAIGKLGIELIDLVPAKPTALSVEEQAMWGSYYDYDPVVYATNVNDGYQKVTSNPMIMKLMGGIISYCYSLGQQRFF
jgi:hypothetical protein